LEAVLWCMGVKTRDRKQKDEDNNFNLLSIRDIRIILIKNMDDTTI
jgi:hypothetical protein